MSDELRAVLTEALSEALKRLWTDPEDAADQAAWDALPGKLADVIASLPGVAVTQLPEPDRTDNDAQTFYADYGIRVDNSVSGREGRIWTDFGLGTEFKCEMNAAGAMWWAKMFAAASLAAAAAVVATGEEA
ncbi:hypothetical protein AVV73_gp079 [Mycobacterium phage CaptainTrips]|uniref:Uncharacterized protein n=1 Tax=Mycobacterium phage CaptainTrips TaxID=1556289 RepID=A0A0A0RKL6_9CAUD|nr:hypothetical protein AVV73_gp079 [Mycobacterium phage CaptainTrips]AIW02471.1 hypothetical protein PBI_CAPTAINTRIPS_79 [Mycobacterium phage CaptainTrips]